jgi:Tol biopolymer transport system component
MNTDGTGLRNLTPGSPAYDAHPSWSPDGRRIAFFSDRDGNNDIYLLDVGQSAPPRNITDGFENTCNNNPAWQ